MRTPLVLLAPLAASMLLALGCSSGPVQGDPALPPGFAEARVPKADLSAYVYISQGATVPVPTSWFADPALSLSSNPAFASLGASVALKSITLAVGPTVDHLGVQATLTSEQEAEAVAQLARGRPLTEAWASGSTLGLVYGSGDWPGKLKSSIQLGDGLPFSRAYTDSWQLLRMMPESAPGQPIAVGFARTTGSVLEQASANLGLDLKGVPQAMGSLNITQGVFVAYAQQPLVAPEHVDITYFKQHGVGVIAAAKSSYPGFLLGFFLNSFANQAGLEKGTQVSGRDVLARDLGDAYLVAAPIGSVLFITIAPEKSGAEALMAAVLEQQ